MNGCDDNGRKMCAHISTGANVTVVCMGKKHSMWGYLCVCVCAHVCARVCVFGGGLCIHKILVFSKFCAN